jgi:hypothetical protein
MLLDTQQYPAQSTRVGITLKRLDGTEEHIWSFRLPRSASRLDARGAGTLKASSTRLSGYGVLSITSAPPGKRHLTTCAPGIGTTATRTVALTGRLQLATKSSGKHRWG